MIRSDLDYMRQNVKVVGRCAGFTYADLGPTHHSLEDIAVLRTIPGLTIVCAGDPVEIAGAVRRACEHDGPVYLRVGRPAIPVLFSEKHELELGRGEVMKDGSDLAIVATGTMLANTAEAARLLEQEGVSVMLINLHTLKPADRALLVRAAERTRGVLTVEDHNLAGGLGSIVAEVLVREGPAAHPHDRDRRPLRPHRSVAGVAGVLRLPAAADRRDRPGIPAGAWGLGAQAAVGLPRGSARRVTSQAVHRIVPSAVPAEKLSLTGPKAGGERPLSSVTVQAGARPHP